MKIKLFTALILCSTVLYSQNESLGKKYSIGAGESYSGASDLGGNLKFNYLKSEKLSFGLSSFLTTYKTNPNSDENLYMRHGMDRRPLGHLFGVQLGGTCYFLGNNSESKSGLYGTLGFDFSQSLYSDTKTMQNANIPIYYDEKHYTNSFSSLICLGVDIKVGRGRIYTEINILSPLYTTVKSPSYTTVKPPPYTTAKSLLYTKVKTKTHELFFDDDPVTPAPVTHRYYVPDRLRFIDVATFNIGYSFFLKGRTPSRS